MKKILLLIFIISLFFTVPAGAAQNSKTPFKFWISPSRDFQAGMRQNPVPPETVAYLKGLAMLQDLVVPLRATYNAGGKLEYANWNYPILKSVNPDIFVMEYANPRNWAGNIFEQVEIPENWYLHDPVDQLRIENRVVTFWWTIDPDLSKHNEWMYDMGNPDFVQFFAGKVVYALQQGLDGLWMDNGGLTTDKYIMKVKRLPDGAIVNPINPRTQMSYTAAEQHAEYLNMAQAVRNAVNEAFPSGLSNNGLPIMLPPNVAENIIAPEWDVVDLYGSVMSEGGGWFAHSTLNAYSQTRWLRDVNNVVEAMHRGLSFVYMGKSYKDITPWPGSNRMLFTYASALLAAGAPGDRFFFRYNFGGYESWPGFNVDIGYANGDYFKWPGTNNIYARWFDRALVLVNPSTTAETVNPGVTYQPFVDYSDRNGNGTMDWRGLGAQSFAPVVISGYEAAILVTSQTPTPTPTPADIKALLSAYVTSQADFDVYTDGKVNSLDFAISIR